MSRDLDLFGVRVEDVLAKAAGAIGTQALDAQIATPLLQKFAPSLSGMTARAADVITTFISAKCVGLLVGVFDRGYREDVEDGGYILAGLKTVAIPFPALLPNVPYPSVLNFSGFGLGAPAATAALPTANAFVGGTAAPAAGAPALPAGLVTSYAHPAVVTDDAGI